MNNNSIPEVCMGPMNKHSDKHPETIIAVCKFLDSALPEDAVCGNQPSHYIGEDTIPSDFDSIFEYASVALENLDKEEIRKDLKIFNAKYKTQLNMKYTSTDLAVYFLDWLFFCKNRGFSRNDYFDFEFYNKEWKVRDTFVNNGFRRFISFLCVDRRHRGCFMNKVSFNETFKDFIHRDWLECSKCTFEEFKAFTDKHSRFFVKPLGKSGGAGAEILDTTKVSVEELYEKCKTNELLAEEIIQQHAELAAYNASTLNTIRVLSIVDAHKEPHILLGVARFGRAGNVVDNFHGGGVGAIVDVETGVIFTDAIDSVHLRTVIHPDSKLQIRGFRIPEWEKVKETIKKAALVVPQVKHVGWDVAITKDGEVELVEGNSHSGFDILQSPDQVGRRFLYNPYLSALEKRKRMKRPEYPPVDIDAVLKDKKVYINKFRPYIVEVTARSLKIRKTPVREESDVVGAITDQDAYIIVDECKLGNTTFGKLKNGKGWISLDAKFVKIHK